MTSTLNPTFARLCDGDAYEARVHTCDDPLSCSLGALIEGPLESQTDALEGALEAIRELCKGTKGQQLKTVRVERVLAEIAKVLP